ncbi:hypothetical protein ANN_19479 [Periplaneta americana]|uniref:Phospholipase A(1) n=1 Tax=Periplaneta americana TaxID=6978 RepID=A0ABQ8SA07_PERAM|nr:hypothetical protein ANN_19479 [Periplaneta americana]
MGYSRAKLKSKCASPCFNPQRIGKASYRNWPIRTLLLSKYLLQKERASPARFHMIGHSLGAHTSGYVAKKIPGIGRVTANGDACTHVCDLMTSYDINIHSLHYPVASHSRETFSLLEYSNYSRDAVIPGVTPPLAYVLGSEGSIKSSSDLAPCDFFLYLIAKKDLKGRRFDNEIHTVKVLAAILKCLSKDSFENVFREWQRRYLSSIVRSSPIASLIPFPFLSQTALLPTVLPFLLIGVYSFRHPKISPHVEKLL